LSVAILTRAAWPSSPLAAGHAAIAGLLVQGAYLAGVFCGVARGMPLATVSLIVGLQPILTAMAAGPMLGERLSGRQWAGIALGFGGVVLVVSGKWTGASADAIAYAWLVLALAGITAGTLYQKRFCARFDLRTGSLIQFVPTAVLTAVVVALYEDFRIDWTPEFVLALAWLVLVLSLGAISLLNLLIRSGSAVNVASLFYLTPLSTALIAWVVFGEKLTLAATAGMALAVGGVYLVARPAK